MKKLFLSVLILSGFCFGMQDDDNSDSDHDDTSRLDDLNRTPLMAAIEGGSVADVRAALEAFPSDLNSAGLTWGKGTPIMMAVRRGDMEIIKAILQKKPDHDHWEDLLGFEKTAVKLAIDNDRGDILQALIDAGAHKNLGSNPLTPLCYALGSSRYERARQLLECGVDPNETKVLTPLHYAVMYDLPEMVKLLIAKGADPEKESFEHQTPLILAIRSDRIGMVELLINLGASVNALDQSLDYTALDWAVTMKNIDIFKLLIHHGATLDSVNKRGKKLWTRVQEDSRLTSQLKQQILDILQQSGASK